MAFNPFTKGAQISLSDLQQEMNRMFDRMWHGGISTGPLDGQSWAPAIELLSFPAQFVLTAEAPGLTVNEIEVYFEDGELVLKGAKVAPQRSEDECKVIRCERRFGNFCRRIPIPEAINIDGISASCKRGVLEVILPKKEPAKRTSFRIEVTDQGDS